MRKNQSKYKKQEYVKKLIDNAIKYDNVSFIEIKDMYSYFNCSEHGEFKKRLDHLDEFKYNPCPSCSRKYSSKKASETVSKKHTVEDYVDTNLYKPVSNYINSITKMKFLCIKHKQEFEATPNRCFGCEECKKEHHYKWESDWGHIDQEEIIKRCKAIHPEYDYSKVNYINATTPIEIICPIHGSFYQTYANHTHKTHPQRCPACAHKNRKSRLSLKVKNILDELKLNYNEEKTFEWLKYKNNMYLDYYISKYNIVIEVQGPQHFTYMPNVFHNSFTDFKEQRLKDKIKYETCIEHGLTILYFANKYDKKIIPDTYYANIITDLDELKNILNTLINP